MKKLKNIFLILTSAIVLFLAGSVVLGVFAAGDKNKPVETFENDGLQDGDIIFQTSMSSQSRAIQLATKSKYSHMGLIYAKDSDLYVLEAVQPVKLTPMIDWISKGYKKHFVIKRLRAYNKIMTSEIKSKMKKVEERFMNKDYDIFFEWSDERIYCSELVWKIYKEAANVEIGKLQKLRDFDLSGEIVQKIMNKRYGDKIPLDEVVISPASIFESELLEIIKENE